MRRERGLAEPATLWVAVLTVVILVTGLVSVCLPDEPRRSSHYDGDEDDVAIVQDRSGGNPIVVIIPAVRAFELRQLTRPADQGRVVQLPPATTSGPIVSRAPPV